MLRWFRAVATWLPVVVAVASMPMLALTGSWTYVSTLSFSLFYMWLFSYFQAMEAKTQQPTVHLEAQLKELQGKVNALLIAQQTKNVPVSRMFQK